MAKGGKVIWNELVTTNQKASGDFLASLFGWERKEVDMGPMGTYTLFQADGQDVAGMMDPLTEFSRSRPPFWSLYVEVDDVDACAERAEVLGGAKIAGPEDIPNVGRVCMVTDPDGTPICMMKPLPPA